MTALMLSPEEQVHSKYFMNNVVIQKNPAGRFYYGNVMGPRFGSGHGRQIADGNVFWRPTEANVEPGDIYWLFYFYENGAQNPTVKSFATLAEFQASPLYSMTKTNYPPGFDARSVFADPALDANYQPAADSPAATAQIDLSAEYTGWPNDDSKYIGAYPPAGSPIECLP
jgi:hypothetical protein